LPTGGFAVFSKIWVGIRNQNLFRVGRAADSGERRIPLSRFWNPVAAVVLLASRLPASFRLEPRGSLRFMLRPRVRHGGRAAVCLRGYVAPAPGVMRTNCLIVVAAIILATAGAATVFSLLRRPVVEQSFAAGTLVAIEVRPMTAGTSVAAQQPTEPQEV